MLYSRSIRVVALLAVALGFAFSSLRLDIYDALLPVFEWMETTPFGVIGKTWGAVFAVVEAVHLLAMAVLGGSVLVSDGRLAGLFFTDVPMSQLLGHCHRLFVFSLVVMVLTGVFMACGVALKVYYLDVFWYKMLALATGVAFVFFIRRPLLRQDAESLPVWLRRAVALSSLMIWFSVAATGRWIGFS